MHRVIPCIELWNCSKSTPWVIRAKTSISVFHLVWNFQVQIKKTVCRVASCCTSKHEKTVQACLISSLFLPSAVSWLFLSLKAFQATSLLRLSSIYGNSSDTSLWKPTWASDPGSDAVWSEALEVKWKAHIQDSAFEVLMHLKW